MAKGDKCFFDNLNVSAEMPSEMHVIGHGADKKKHEMNAR